MSEIGEAIINRMPLQSPIRNPNNPMNKIINNSVGEYMDSYDLDSWFKQHFITDATGKYLDVHGKDYGVKRKTDETDEDYRKRIIYELLGHLTVGYVREVYEVDLYIKPSTSYSMGSTLTSDNEHLIDIEQNGFLGITDNTTKAILNKKFVLGDSITWL